MVNTNVFSSKGAKRSLNITFLDDLGVKYLTCSSSKNNNNANNNNNKEQTITAAPSFFFVSTLFYKQRLWPRVLFCPPPLEQPICNPFSLFLLISTNKGCGPVCCFDPPPPTTLLQTKTVAPCVVLTPPLQQHFYKNNSQDDVE